MGFFLPVAPQFYQVIMNDQLSKNVGKEKYQFSWGFSFSKNVP